MKICLIDDHVIVTDALKTILSTDEAVEEVRTFSSASNFMALFNDLWVPDVIVIDLLMPGMTGMDFLEEMKQRDLKSKPRVIILSSITDCQTIKHAIRLGASGYLSKVISIAELHEAINSVYNGGQYICKSLRNSLMSSMFSEEQIVFHLSRREKDVLALICSGNTVKEAAYKLKLSIHTVQGYQKSIMKKFKVNRTADLIVFTIQKGLYMPPLQYA